MTDPPYRTAVRAGDFLYVSGQLGTRDGGLVDGGFLAELDQALANLAAVLADHDAAPGDVVKVNVYLRDIADWPRLNGPYTRFFGTPLPARTAIGAGDIPHGGAVEIEAVAYLGG